MLRPIGALMMEAGHAWAQHRANRMAAAFAFYTLLSIAPALVLAIGVAGMFLDQQSVRESVLDLARESFGPRQAEFLQDLILATASRTSGLRATLVGVPLLLLGASAMFAHLHEATNVIWGTYDPRPGLRGAALGRLLAVALVLVMGLVLLAWLALDASLGFATVHARAVLDPSFPLYRALSFAAGIVFWALVFAMFLRALPATRLRLRDAVPGALLMSLGFGLGRHGLALYFSYSDFSAAYGAAGAVVVLLLWTYFSAMLYFYCTELTRLVAQRREQEARDGAAPRPVP